MKDKNMNSHVQRWHHKTSKGERWGLRRHGRPGPSGPASAENQPKGRFSGRFGPQTCARGVTPLDPYLANKDHK